MILGLFLKAGRNALYLTSDGNILEGSNLATKSNKSLDFYFKIDGFECYAMHKYTKEGGGNQDSQYKEMIKVLRDFQNCTDQHIVLFIIVDGYFYEEKKMQDLVRNTRTLPPRSFACKIQDVPNKIEELLAN